MSRSITPSIQTFRRNSSASAEKTHGLQSFGITITKKKEIPPNVHPPLHPRLHHRHPPLHRYPHRNKDPSIMNNPNMTPKILSAKIKLPLQEDIASRNLGLSTGVI